MMETATKPMTPREKIQRLLDTKKQAERDAKERYQNDPEYRAIFEKLREENANRRANQ